MLITNILHISVCRAITQHNLPEVIKLIDIGADVNTQCEYNMNYTPLIVAVKNSNLEMVKILLSQFHADPNIGDSDDWTPLMFAAIQDTHESLDIVKLLVYYQANIYQKNQNGLNAIELADLGRNRKIFNYLTSF